MKMNQWIFPLVIALAATMASTGCKKGTPKTTVIPGHNQPLVGGDGGAGTLPPGNTMDLGPGPGMNVKPGGGDTANINDFDNMIQDRSALASYTVHFAFDSATVKSTEQSNISAVASALAASSSDKLLIEGHCDERGTEEYNRSLGERRALALREALAKAGVDPARIRTISYGKDKPVDTGHDESAFSKNRRGEFILLHPKAGA